jgi:hypothetical protein
MWSKENYESLIKEWTERENFVHTKSWHIPSDSLIEALKKYTPLVSVGAGLGYTESLAIKEGVDIIATDLYPDPCVNKYFKNDVAPFLEVETLDAQEAIKKYQGRNVFMAWPPYSRDMAFRVACAMSSGKFLIYIGEAPGGCTADDEFFNYLESDFIEIEHGYSIKTWFGIRDRVFIYQKK